MALFPDDLTTCHQVIRAMAQQRAAATERVADLEIQLQAAIEDIERLREQLAAIAPEAINEEPITDVPTDGKPFMPPSETDGGDA